MSYRGIAPARILEQVQNTAAWALRDHEQQAWAQHLLQSNKLNAWESQAQRGGYLSVMLSAHFTTVATFVPTDVDTHIRHHHWWGTETAEELRASLLRIDEAATWDPRLVSNRTVDVPELGTISGHDGEWLSVRAGALGRALALDDKESIDKLVGQIDAEVEREAACYRAMMSQPARSLDALRVATLVAHNLGDLSRVVDQWKTKAQHASLHARFVRLTHEAPERHNGVFIEIGRINKDFMADENHRYLPLRKPRAIRQAKQFVIPFGPFFDAWGELLATDKSLQSRDRAEVIEAVLHGHEQQPNGQSYLRALAGFHRAHRGGLDRLVAEELPAKAKRAISGGAIRGALQLSQEAFEARIVKRYLAAKR